jgi:organic hydroperoxide reductase OsmC/OhrA
MTQHLAATSPDRLLYTAKVHTTGGREGASRSSDGHLDIKLSTPGAARPGTNPEQLFAAGWSACFEGAMGLAARKRKITLPAGLAIDAEVDLLLAEGVICFEPASPSACRELSPISRWAWWKKRTKTAHIPKLHEVTSR